MSALCPPQRQVRIGNGAGFLGDQLDAPRRLVESAELDYLTLEYLAELTMSILAHVRSRRPEAGYAGDFLDVLRLLLPALAAQPKLKIITNAGGVNVAGCVQAAAALLHEAGLGDVPIGQVTGDDLLPRLDELAAQSVRLEHQDSGEPLAALHQPVLHANAYLGAEPIVRALGGGARIVVTGRVADASLTLGPAVHEFAWPWDDWDRLADGSVAGHLIECGAQVTGGYFPLDWRATDYTNIGYPIAEIQADGRTGITKPAGSGGVVNLDTVRAQLVYEIGDPQHYLTPDVDVDFSTVEVQETAPNHVLVHGARGRPAPPRLKVSLGYRAGYQAAGQLVVAGHDAVARAEACAEIVWRRLAACGCLPQRRLAECLGAGDAAAGVWPRRQDCEEVVLRLAVQDPQREVVERFTKEIAPLITNGPAGLGGYAAGRAEVRPAFGYWPTSVPRELVQPVVEVRPAREWSTNT